MTLRHRQRGYYSAPLDRLFPGLRQKYERRFGQRYSCAVNGTAPLEAVFREACARSGLATRIPLYGPPAAVQGRLIYRKEQHGD